MNTFKKGKNEAEKHPTIRLCNWCLQAGLRWCLEPNLTETETVTLLKIGRGITMW